MTLGHAAAAFARRPTPRLLAAAVVAAAAVRLAVGDWSWTDAVVAGAILAAEPFTEWVIHVFLLHLRPRRIGRFTVDPLVARKHRAHHADPRRLDLVFIPGPVVWIALAIGAGVPLLLADTVAVAATASLTAFAMLLTYEWTHYLIHTTYRPRTALYRRIWRAHRWHHYRNERYWFGVTVHLADRLLGTYPDKDDVEVSPTARQLHEGAPAA